MLNIIVPFYIFHLIWYTLKLMYARYFCNTLNVMNGFERYSTDLRL